LKLVTYSDKKAERKTRAGILWGTWILDIAEIADRAQKLDVKVPASVSKLPQLVPSILEVLERGPRLLDDLKNLSWRIFNRMKPKDQHGLRKLESLTLRAPILHPPSLRDFYAFEEHVKAARARRGLEIPPEWYEFPAFYYSNPAVIIGPAESVPMPSYTKALDFELEIACVIGKSGVNVPENEAESFIAGYTIMNDWSARDIQQREMKVGLGPAKAKDFATSLGPWLVTKDELEDRQVGPGKFRLEMTATVNSKRLSHGNMEEMYWSFPQMIARASQSVQLQPGEVFGSGTVGTGSILELGTDAHRWLEPGDVVELEIERLGKLANKVIRG
jgi:2-keto-4-pentenoate hydratase/2-oxohepta-3-ene-1,7-dioic acid hydratase in catechol pathway